MPLYSFEGKSPRVHPTAFIASTAAIIGEVTIEENASVWYINPGAYQALAQRHRLGVQPV